VTIAEAAAWDVFELHARSYADHLHTEDGVAVTLDRCVERDKVWPCPTYEAVQPAVAAESAARGTPA